MIRGEKAMRLIKFAVVIFFVPLLLTGCLNLYADYKMPYDLYVDKVQPGAKEGRASIHSVLWLFSWGDQGVPAAAKNRGITTVNHADAETFQVLFGIYTRQTIVVYGD